jgi:hypothetical protein
MRIEASFQYILNSQVCVGSTTAVIRDWEDPWIFGVEHAKRWCRENSAALSNVTWVSRYHEVTNLSFGAVYSRGGAIASPPRGAICQVQDATMNLPIEHHTKAPWHPGMGNGEGSIFPEDGRTRLEAGGTTLYPIATVNRGWDQEEDEANGRLIAVSPEFYDFAKLILLRQEQDRDIPADIVQHARRLIEKVYPKESEAASPSPEKDPPEALVCSCCGRPMRGRQWWNRDTGWGLCRKCIPLNKDADIPHGEQCTSFGIRGFHFDLPEETQ